MYSVTLLSFTVCADYMSVHIYVFKHSEYCVCVSVHTLKWTNVCEFLLWEKIHLNGEKFLSQAVSPEMLTCPSIL